uniref:Protein FAM162A isoform X2 n=1 Tax=Pogona vitticeps TaxID=103695 RepID=A0A6J0TCA1_9SAUR|nr:protein FAM162A isoform X3 [Pogona vitticeps]XP_020645168.1 protein FAM162A isoform X4 [Pogona vitticeps]
MAGPLAAAAGKMKTLWNRNIFASLQTGSPLRVATRRLCSKPPPEDGAQLPRPAAPGTSYQPMYKNVVSPSRWNRRVLLLTGRYKKEEDIPEFVPASVIHAAASKLRVYIGCASIVLTLIMFFFAARSGKRAMEEGRSLRAVHLEKKAKLLEQTMESSSPKV